VLHVFFLPGSCPSQIIAEKGRRNSYMPWNKDIKHMLIYKQVVSGNEMDSLKSMTPNTMV